MNTIKYLLILLTLWLGIAGCDDFLGDNKDPDAVDKVPPHQIMPVVLFYSALQNFDHGEYGNYLAQSLTTAGKSQTGAFAYRGGWEFLGMNRHPQWRRHYYDVGSNANELIKYAEDENSVNYIALTRLLRLISVQQTTDVFGDMPLTQAYKSSSPKYDTQESIYQWMENEANELIELFNNPDVYKNTNRPMDIKTDRVFGGDMTKWKQLVFAIQARILLRKIPNISTDVSTCNKIISAAETALTGWSDPKYKFDGGSSVEKNCMWGRNNKPVNSWESRQNDLNGAIPSKFFMENILGYNAGTDNATDPRLAYIMKKRANDIGEVKFRYLESNSGMPASHKIEWYPDMYENVMCNDTSTIILFTRGELHFIISEAAYWAGDKIKAVDHLKNGIQYHMNRLKVPGSAINAFLENPVLVPGTSNITISHIMRQKYIAMYLQPELWNDLRRYGYSNDVNNRKYDNVVVYPGLRRPHNLYEAYWAGTEHWIQRLNYDPETEEKYNRNELIRLGAFRNHEWLKKPMIWAPQN